MKKVLTRHLVSTAVVVGALAAAGLAGAQTAPPTGPVVVCGFTAQATKPASGLPVRIGTPVQVGQHLSMLCRTVSGVPLVKTVGSVTDVTPKSITVAGVTCAFAPNPNTKPMSGLPVRVGSKVSCHVAVNVVGAVSAVTPKTVTVSGITCALPTNSKPGIMLHARVGNNVAMACNVAAGKLKVTKLLKR
jgi:hypothetical protein